MIEQLPMQAIFGTISAAVVLFIGAGGFQTRREVIAPHYCEEVAYELKLAVNRGLLTAEQASTIVDKCWSTANDQ